MQVKTFTNQRRALERRNLLSLATAALIQNRPRHLSIVPESSLFPTPKFKVGDSVRFTWVCDDEVDLENFGKTFHDDGIIGGLVWNLPNNFTQNRWLYFVQWVEQSGWHLEEISEEELSPLPD